MLYSKTTKYAILSLAELARHAPGAAVPTRKIAEAAGAPYPLLAKVMIHLNRSGLVESVRGKAGGVRLAKPAEEIRILDVVTALEGDGILHDCPLFLEACSCEQVCDFHEIWKPARDGLIRFLERTSIRSVADAQAAGASG